MLIMYQNLNIIFMQRHIFHETQHMEDAQNISWRDPNLANLLYFDKFLFIFFSFYRKK